MLIKKEKDRKFYNSTIKKYITLKEIFSYINNKIYFKVIDENNKDISEKTCISSFLKYGDLKELNSILIPKKTERVKVELSKEHLLSLKATLPSPNSLEVYKSTKKEDWIEANQTIQDFKFKNERFYHISPQSFNPEFGDFLLIFKENNETIGLLHLVKGRAKNVDTQSDCSIIFYSIKKDINFIKKVQSFFLEEYLELILKNIENSYFLKSLNRIGLITQKIEGQMSLYSIYNDVSGLSIIDGEFKSLGLKTIPKSNYIGNIDFTDNEIDFFEPDFFNEKCKSVVLRYNEIKTLPENIELKCSLSLSHNEIEDVELNWKFNGSLDLSNNKIKVLPKVIEQNGFPLNLCYNQIHTIEEGFVQNGVLQLNGNQINSISDNYFHKKGELYLGSNLITEVPGFNPVDKVSLVGNKILNKDKAKSVFFTF